MEFTSIGKAKQQTKLSYLGSINSSAKIMKNGKVNKQHTYIIYLAPAMTSGYNVCMYSTPECRLGCLSTSGRAAMEITAGKKVIENARIVKTKLFHEQQQFFMQWMIAEMKSYKAKAEKAGYGFSARLNGTSDIDWSKVLYEGKNIFEIFPDTILYDYTKDISKVMNYIAPNYRLTLSYTGMNWNVAEMMLKRGMNVAVVFNVKKGLPLPTTFKGYEVIDGDLTDFRPSDGNGVIVGLRFKKIQNKEVEKDIIVSKFVVQPDDNDCIL